MTPTNSGPRQVHHRTGRVTDKPQAISGRESPPRIDLALLDVDRGRWVRKGGADERARENPALSAHQAG